MGFKPKKFNLVHQTIFLSGLQAKEIQLGSDRVFTLEFRIYLLQCTRGSHQDTSDSLQQGFNSAATPSAGLGRQGGEVADALFNVASFSPDHFPRERCGLSTRLGKMYTVDSLHNNVLPAMPINTGKKRLAHETRSLLELLCIWLTSLQQFARYKALQLPFHFSQDMAYSPEIIEHAHILAFLSHSQTDMTGIGKMVAKEIIQVHVILYLCLPYFFRIFILLYSVLLLILPS